MLEAVLISALVETCGGSDCFCVIIAFIEISGIVSSTPFASGMSVIFPGVLIKEIELDSLPAWISWLNFLISVCISSLYFCKSS